MFSINIKGRPDPRDAKMVKLEMVFFVTGYPRVTKVINISGIYKNWDNKIQSFKPRTSECNEKNVMLFELKQKYQNVAEQWDAENKSWSPVQLSHCFDKEAAKKQERKVITVSKAIDTIVADLKARERIKNGMVMTSVGTAKSYFVLQKKLVEFTEKEYGKSFSTYYFSDIDSVFIDKFITFLKKRGIEQGHSGAVPTALKKLYGVFIKAKEELKIADIDMEILKPSKVEMKAAHKNAPPKTLPPVVLAKIENIDRSLFSKLENFYIDLFLFSYYTGGMANVDVAYLTWDCIKDGMLTYERIKFPKEAAIPFLNKAKEIAEKYKSQCFGNYVLPVFTYKHDTDAKRRGRLKRLYEKTNKTLEKVRKVIRYNDKITWYAARGTFITKMIVEGMHPVDVAKFAGNSPNTIYKHYYKQIDPKKIRNTLNQLV